jgi:hypothetical protein
VSAPAGDGRALAVIEEIRRAFRDTPYPGDALLASADGGSLEELGGLVGRREWQAVDAATLDGSYDALSLLSEAGFRFFLPAYLVADVEGALRTADPVFHLTMGFHDGTVETQAGGRRFVRRFGASALVNPRRYGAITFADVSRRRLAVFTREEAAAIVAYLSWRRDAGPDATDRAAIDAALDAFWRHRAARAPTAGDLERHLETERQYVDALMRDRTGGAG